jgi:plasmid stability protein
MTALTIRNLDEQLKNRLRIQAARHNRSMEEEVRTILRDALTEQADSPVDLGAKIHARFRELGGVDLALESREPIRPPPRIRR